MQDSWPPPEADHLEESTEEIDILFYDVASVDLPIGAGCSAVVCNVLPNTPSTETVGNTLFSFLPCLSCLFSDQFNRT